MKSCAPREAMHRRWPRAGPTILTRPASHRICIPTAVETDDIRIVYNSNGMVFPYIKELEVFSSEFMYMSYYGHPLGNRTMKGKAPNLVTDFAARTLIPRSKYLDKISPIQYFEVTKNFDIKVLAWI